MSEEHVHSLILTLNGETRSYEFGTEDTPHFGQCLDWLAEHIVTLRSGGVHEIEMHIRVYCHERERNVVTTVHPVCFNAEDLCEFHNGDSGDSAYKLLEQIMRAISPQMEIAVHVVGGLPWDPSSYNHFSDN